MGLIKNLKGMKDAVVQGVRTGGPTEEQLASMSPEQRAAYDAQQASLAATMQTAQVEHDARLAARPLQGPAGDFVYGTTTSAQQMATMTPAQQIAHSVQGAKDGLRDVLRNPLGLARPAPLPAGAPTGQVDRERQALAERAARDQARAPYRAPHGAPIAFARIATRGATQVQELSAYLASSGLAGRPDLVYGVSRVPDRISPSMPGGERRRVVEWDVVHAATTALPPAPMPASAWFESADTWVARRVGEPSVVDEDLALAYLVSAGISPEQCLGIARHLTIDNVGGGDDSSGAVLSEVTGVLAFHVGGAGAATFGQMVAARPFAIAAGPPPGYHLEVLNWAAVAKAVQPSRQEAVPIPSPFPYLPTTAHELLAAYIEVVGLYPGDCCSAQITEDRPTDLMSNRTTASGSTVSSNIGPEVMCADGTVRRRLLGGSRIVLAYRDCPEYHAGRERWAAYQRSVLQASLGSDAALRPTIERPAYASVPSPLRGLLKAAEKVADFVDGDGNDVWGKIPPHRYCWPPRT